MPRQIRRDHYRHCRLLFRQDHTWTRRTHSCVSQCRPIGDRATAKLAGRIASSRSVPETGRALPHQNAPGAAMLCQAAHGRNKRLRRLVHGSRAAGCIMVDTAEPACLNRGSARPAFLFDQRACFPAPTWRCGGHGARRRGWEERSHPQAPWREHGEDGDHRTSPEVRTVARLTADGRSDGLHRYVTGCSGDCAWSLWGTVVPNTKMMRVFPPPNLTRRCSVRSNLSGTYPAAHPGAARAVLSKFAMVRRQTTHAIAPPPSGAGQGIGANICRHFSSAYSSDEPPPPAMTPGDLRGTSRVSANSPIAVSLVAGRSAISTSCFWARRISLSSRTGSSVACKAFTQARTASARTRIGQQPLIRCRRRVVVLRDLRAVACFTCQLKGRLKEANK